MSWRDFFQDVSVQIGARTLASGLGRYEDVRLHVSAGIGMERGVAPQIRFRCPPEVCLIEVHW